MVEFDKGLTLLSAPHWQLDNYCLLSSCFVTSISLLFKFTIQPLSHTRSLTLFALSCHSLHLCCCSFTSNFSPSFYETFSFFSTTLPYLVVLLDTTTVLGELDWKTYPVNGVSDPGISWIKAINCLRFYWSKKTSDTPPPLLFFLHGRPMMATIWTSLVQNRKLEPQQTRFSCIWVKWRQETSSCVLLKKILWASGGVFYTAAFLTAVRAMWHPLKNDMVTCGSTKHSTAGVKNIC